MTEHKRWFRVQSIGWVEREDQAGPDEFLDPARPSVIRMDPRWESGLTGIEDFSHLVVLFYLDRAQRRRTAGSLMRPEGRAELPEVGFFAMRTPKRPNPVGISCPRLVRREGNALHVTGIDAWDGTPVIDIKGYYPRDELRADATVPRWLTTLWGAHDGERSGPGEDSVVSTGPRPGTVVAEHETERGVVTFRFPLPTDAPAALEYINTISAEQTYILFQGEQLTLQQEQAWLDDRLAKLTSLQGITLIATAGERIIGTTAIDLGGLAGSHVGYFGIGLAREWRDMGLGTRLMQSVIDQAERHLPNLRLIQLDVFASNERAIHLYQRLGFMEYGRLPGAILRRGEYDDTISMYRIVSRL